jgi:hypothetical protein
MSVRLRQVLHYDPDTGIFTLVRHDRTLARQKSNNGV